ncbi:ABC transporter ATP-binding protein [Salinibacterium hongtaonis]|uniref:ABC transporter ATP-binding protein n=1 Tax=Homoserinimonas hongtaonis TaxID=2079791 RepID=A0A2U1SZM5_9MICO|nr:ABC transporter ATP-binding protein [Salinibacterium hongtaonis]AWB89603.1 hypothetical protein C2138_08670 [Salinibacterium hongtaonis]PWB97048.1 ABC transporter ATP-binding protein [Salinibacterium hongtaonis]
MVGSAPESAVALSASGLTKRFGEREAVSALTLSIGTGRAFGLLGPNGAGKTTTVRLLTGLLAATRGEVTLLGERLTPATADRLRSRIGVQTDTELYLSLSVRDNLRYWGELYGLSAGRIARRTGDVLDGLGLAGRIDSPVGELSKGMRQKLSVGRAILHEPELLFLDEPTAGLDPEASEDLIALLKGMIRHAHTTVVMCTHQLHGLETLCDDIGVLIGGRLAACGEVSQLLRERWPRTRYEIEIQGNPDAARQTIGAVVNGLVETDPAGRIHFSIAEGQSVATVVSELVTRGVPITAVVPEQPTIQDLYFATIAEGVLT